MKKLVISFILLIFLFVLTGCENNKTDEELLQEKLLSELNFVEKTAIEILEKYLEGDYIVENQINWEEINNDFKNVSNSSSVIILDLTSKQISYDLILEFETRINNVNSAINNEIDIDFLESIRSLYELLPEYLSEIYSEEDYVVQEKRVTQNLLNSLYYCMIDDYNSSLFYLEEAEKIYGDLMNNTEFLSENSYEINRVYISIQEMKLAIQNQEKQNVILKFISTN